MALTPKDARLRRIYGITEEEFDALVEATGGVCPICWRPPTVWCVDHDHVNGLIRGVCCSFCNQRVIGRHRNPDLFTRAAEYLTHPPAVELLGPRTVPQKVRRKGNGGRRRAVTPGTTTGGSDARGQAEVEAEHGAPHPATQGQPPPLGPLRGGGRDQGGTQAPAPASRPPRPDPRPPRAGGRPVIGADDIDPEDLASGFHVEGPDPDELADEAWLDDEWILDAGDDLPDVSMFDPGEDPFPAELLDDSEHPYDPFPEEG